MSKRSFRVALAVVIGSVILVVGIAGWFVHRAFAYPDEAHSGSGKEIEVEIKSGMSFPAVASLLASQHIIERPTWFRLYAMQLLRFVCSFAEPTSFAIPHRYAHGAGRPLPV